MKVKVGFFLLFSLFATSWLLAAEGCVLVSYPPEQVAFISPTKLRIDKITGHSDLPVPHSILDDEVKSLLSRRAVEISA